MILSPRAAAAAYKSGEGAMISERTLAEGMVVDAAAAVAEGARSSLEPQHYADAVQRWLPHEAVRSGLLGLPVGIGVTAIAGAGTLRAFIDSRRSPAPGGQTVTAGDPSGGQHQKSEVAAAGPDKAQPASKAEEVTAQAAATAPAAMSSLPALPAVPAMPAAASDTAEGSATNQANAATPAGDTAVRNVDAAAPPEAPPPRDPRPPSPSPEERTLLGKPPLPPPTSGESATAGGTSAADHSQNPRPSSPPVHTRISDKEVPDDDRSEDGKDEERKEGEPDEVEEPDTASAAKSAFKAEMMRWVGGWVGGWVSR